MVYTRQRTREGRCRVLIETSNETAYRSLTEHGGPVGTGGTGKQGPKGQEGHSKRGPVQKKAEGGGGSRQGGVVREATQLSQNKY